MSARTLPESQSTQNVVSHRDPETWGWVHRCPSCDAPVQWLVDRRLPGGGAYVDVGTRRRHRCGRPADPYDVAA